MENYEHNYVRAGVVGLLCDAIPEVLGKAEASDEWTEENIDVAKSNFINIESYNKFKDPNCIFLVGRYGSGKTTMLQNYKSFIDSSSDDTVAIFIDPRDYISQLSIALRGAGSTLVLFSEYESVARAEWEKTLTILVMQALYQKFYENYKSDFSKIRGFLEIEGVVSPKFSVSQTLNILVDNLKNVDSTIIQGATATISCIKTIAQPKYRDAVEELKVILSTYRKKVLILIDSIEKYEFSDRIILAVLNSLVNLCIEYSRNSKSIVIKMASPSELIPKLESINPEKLSNKIVYIRWTEKDLKSFIAVRLYKYVNKMEKAETVDLNEAVSFFDDYYPEDCYTRNKIKFPFFPYCMSRTQKEPRQILSIFNALLFFEKKYSSENRMAHVEDAIAHDELSRIKGALSIYSSIHPQMFDMFQRTFLKRKYCFDESEFDEWINVCSGIRGDLDAYDLKTFFISSGLVGTMVEMHYIKQGNPKFDNNNDIRIKETLFEYQYKECLSFNDETKFCLHPMVFCALNIQIDENTIVYPKPFELDDEYTPW